VTYLQDEALQAIADQMDADVILVNATSFTQPGLVFIPGDSPWQRFTRDGETVPVQQTDSGLWLDAGELAPYSVVGLKATMDHRPLTTLAPGASAGVVNRPLSIVLENNFLRVEFNPDGDITRVFDKQANREVLASNAVANQFQAFEDRPSSWDAWDIEIFYDDKMWPAEPASSVEMVEYGELRQTLEIKRKILDSEYTQRVSLSHNSPRLDFDTHIEWNERHILLKVAFPVDVLAPLATYEIQWGNVQRATHHNTSWDWARFETCAQKWVDLSEGNYGVSLLNDCKYGHDIHDHVIRLTLLRSPTMPDPTADVGEHEFKYSLYPHEGSWNEETQREAYLLNDPIIVYKSKEKSPAKRDGAKSAHEKSDERIPNLQSLVSISSPNIIIETVKRAENGDGIIIRLYESQRKRGPVQLSVGFALKTVWITNLLEENETEVNIDQDAIQFDLTPFQIVTLRLIPHTGA
jgi:alpha-mannosidase